MWVWGAIAAVASVYSAVKGSEAARAAGKARADAAMRNAEFMRQQADFARQLGAQRKLQYMDQARKFRSNQEGLFAKAGVDLTGSVLQKLGETSSMTEQRLAQIEWTTKNEAKFGELKAANLELAADDAWKSGVQAGFAAQWQGAAQLAGVMTATDWSGPAFGSFGTASGLGKSILTGATAAAGAVGGMFSSFGTGVSTFGSDWNNFGRMGTGYRN